jgi:hypothetical protein
MTADRTTKALLALIALALWGILLRPLAAPQPAQAQTARGATGHMPAITSVANDGERIYVVMNGKISMWESTFIRPSKKGTPYVRKLILGDVKTLP